MIQVIGETSNKSAELKKFVQTFVLAQQPTGYFVLNDIFRYINEEGEEEAEGDAAEEIAPTADAEVPTEEAVASKVETAAEEPATEAPEAGEAEKAEQAPEAEVAAPEAPATNGADASEEAEEAAAPAEAALPEVVEEEVAQETIKEQETPKEPTPTPLANTEPVLEKPAAPAKPMSWASRAAAAVVSAPKPAIPTTIPTPKTSTPPAQSRAAPPAQPAKPAQAAPAAAVADKEKEKEKESDAAQGAGWQTAGSDHSKRQNRPQSISQPPEKEGTMGYVRYVTEKVSADELRAALASYGELAYFDINRSKVKSLLSLLEAPC